MLEVNVHPTIKRKTRVLIVTHTLGEGGLEEVVRLYARLLNKERFDVTVAYMVGGRISRELEQRGNVRVVCISTPSRPKRFFQLVRLARQLQIDILHNHLSWYGLLAGVFAGAKRVETIHNTYRWYTGTRKWAFAFSCLLAHKLIAVSSVVKDFTLNYFPFIPERKLVVIHNGIDLKRFQSLQHQHGLREQLGFSDADFLVTFVGRLEEQKGLKYLLDAAHQLNRRHMNLKFLLIGEGSLKQQLREQAQRFSVLNVFFLGYRTDVAELLAVSNVFVLPSLYEGLPLTLLQAMAVGTPSVVSRVGGVPEVILDGLNGFLVDPGSVEQLSDKIEQLYNRAELRSQFSRNAQELVSRRFSAEIMVQKTEMLYEELVGTS